MRALAWLLVALPVPACVIDGADDGPAPGPSTVLRQAGYSYGECLGWCSGDLALGGEPVTLTLHSTDRAPDRVNTGTLAKTARIELADAGHDLAAAGLDATYGCPDCADGGASWIGVDHGDLIARSTYEHGNPPAVLARADALTAELIDALATCRSTARITIATCTPR